MRGTVGTTVVFNAHRYRIGTIADFVYPRMATPTLSFFVFGAVAWLCAAMHAGSSCTPDT